MTPETRLEKLRVAAATYRANTMPLSWQMSFAARTAAAELDSILREELQQKILNSRPDVN